MQGDVRVGGARHLVFASADYRLAPVTRGCPHVVCGRHIQGCQGPVLSALVSS